MRDLVLKNSMQSLHAKEGKRIKMDRQMNAVSFMNEVSSIKRGTLVLGERLGETIVFHVFSENGTDSIWSAYVPSKSFNTVLLAGFITRLERHSEVDFARDDLGVAFVFPNREIFRVLENAPFAFFKNDDLN